MHIFYLQLKVGVHAKYTRQLLNWSCLPDTILYLATLISDGLKINQNNSDDWKLLIKISLTSQITRKMIEWWIRHFNLSLQ